MHTPAEFARELSESYERLHVAKEDAFWTAYMGLAGDPNTARADLDRREKALKAFLQDPDRLALVRKELARAESDGATEDTRTALHGWVRMLEAHAIESAEGRALAAEIVDDEGRLAGDRGGMRLGYQVAGEPFREASSVKLAVMIANDRDEKRREAAWRGLQAIEPFVLEHGFLDIVSKRNRLGRMLGGDDYYDWKTKTSEGMRKAEIFALLDELEAKTRDAGRRSIEELKRREGAGAAKPWNVRFHQTGDVSNELDPYFPFAQSFARWGKSFAALGIGFRGADLVLDLVDRKGKYENGFCHGPVPAWRNEGVFRPARVQFTANAIPGMVGSGKRATETFFHEGGHAAHFSNVNMPAPCFSQEFAPTSVAFAETQSMFLDSIIDDADWLTRYAKTRDGEAMPFDLVERAIRAAQAHAAWQVRAMLAVCYCERALYEIPEAELTAARVLDTVRRIERDLLFVEEASPRPVLSVPHLLAGESSAYYHGYVLALMAVQQTRHFFRERDGHLMDNPKIGPDLRRAYWEPGNSKRFPEYVRDLTGEQVSPAALAARVNRTPDEAVAQARGAVDRLPDIAEFTGPVDLDAHVRVMHGHEVVASTDRGFEEAAATFERWVRSQETA